MLSLIDQIIQKFKQEDRDTLILKLAFNQYIKSSTEQWCSQVSKVLPRSSCDANSPTGLPHMFSIFHKDKKVGIGCPLNFPSFSENAETRIPSCASFPQKFSENAETRTKVHDWIGGIGFNGN